MTSPVRVVNIGAGDLDEVAQVDQLLEELVVDLLAQDVALEVDLDAAAAVLDVGERGLAHDAHASSCGRPG